jgi:NAD(P)-dependent dehydrogenase (short-subunit alcohol dehydrogenase family)
MKKLIAIVTGANRGLGLGISRELERLGYEVLKTARNVTGPGEFFPLDVQDDASIEAIAQHVETKWGRLDVLVNNAGVLLDDRSGETLPSRTMIRQTFETNITGAFLMCQRFLPLMKKNGYGRIVNVSSRMGQLANMTCDWPIYRISKAGLNAVTATFANQTSGTNVLVNSVSPGWVRTDMGGPQAPRTLEEGVEGIVWAATLPDGGPTGGFFHDKKSIPW